MPLEIAVLGLHKQQIITGSLLMNKNGKQTHRVAVESFTMNGQPHVDESAAKFTKKGMGILCFYQKERNNGIS